MLSLSHDETFDEKMKQAVVTQTYHQIAFFLYDIEKIVQFNPSLVSQYYLPECSARDCVNGTCANKELTKATCLRCDFPFKYEEILLDGFYTNKTDFIVCLQSGIKVPISKEFYVKIKKFIGKEEEK
jgi:hypothetical protein